MTSHEYDRWREEQLDRQDPDRIDPRYRKWCDEQQAAMLAAAKKPQQETNCEDPPRHRE